MTARPGRDMRVFPDPVALSRAAADLVRSQALKATASHGRFSIALSGGSTPRMLYSLFAEHPWLETMPWPLVHVFWADERCVPPAHADSNYRLAAETFLPRVSLPAGNVHRVRGEEGPDRAAAVYELELKAFFGTAMPAFDLILLGVGEDGHTASLFPRSEQLRERDRLVLPVHGKGPGHSRVTLSLNVLNSARHIIFLVSGAPKAQVVREVMEDGPRSELPAARERPAQGDSVWLLDREAAVSLTPVSFSSG
jgi:6-phosphogluconolactonase